MRGIKLNENEIIKRVSKKGGINRYTLCPFCKAKIGPELRTPKRYPFCGHVVKTWEADGRWYIQFNRYKRS